MAIVHKHRIEKELTDRGLVPKGCRFMSLEIGVSMAVIMRYEKFPDSEEMVRLSQALAAAYGEDSEDAREWALKAAQDKL